MSNVTREEVRELLGWVRGLTLLSDNPEIRPAAMSYVTPGEYRQQVEAALKKLATAYLAALDDAERYQWLRANCSPPGTPEHSGVWFAVSPPEQYAVRSGAELDAAIDAARIENDSIARADSIARGDTL